MFESEAFVELKIREFTSVNDRFQFKNNEAIGHYGQTLINGFTSALEYIPIKQGESIELYLERILKQLHDKKKS